MGKLKVCCQNKEANVLVEIKSLLEALDLREMALWSVCLSGDHSLKLLIITLHNFGCRSASTKHLCSVFSVCDSHLWRDIVYPSGIWSGLRVGFGSLRN